MTAHGPHARLLRFVYAQSYAKAMADTDRAAPPDRVPGVLDEPGLPLDWSAAGMLGALPYPAAAAPPPSPGHRRRALSALLYGGLGVLRAEPSHPFNPHRGYPSARARFPVHGYVLDGARALHYDPVGHRLQPVRPAGAPVGDLPAGPDLAIALAGCFGRFAPGYGPLRYALTVLEAGHVLAGLVQLATALGFAPRVELAFCDRALLDRLALPQDGSWAPLAVVALGEARGELPPPPPAPPVAHDEVAELERMTWLDGADVAAWRTAAPAAAAPAGELQPLPPRAGGGLRSLSDVLFARNAGRAAGGLCGRAAPIASDVLHAAAAQRPPPLDLAASGAGPCGVRAFVIAERVTALPDGIYQLVPDRAAISVVRRGRFLEAAQRGFTYAASSANLRSMNLAWLWAVDYPAVLERRGARGLRLAQLELGWRAHGVCCAAACHGLFARPVRSFRESSFDDLLPLEATEMIGYEVLCGSNRFTDLVFDLRPPPIGAPGASR
jgi:hypothetical protein